MKRAPFVSERLADDVVERQRLVRDAKRPQVLVRSELFGPSLERVEHTETQMTLADGHDDFWEDR
jgi:hypothetical protein